LEAAVSNTCPAVGKSIRDSRFRSMYQAVVVAVARNGERLKQKIGDIVLQPGDTLLLETHRGFAEQYRNSRDFLLISRMDDAVPPLHERSMIAVGIVVALVVAVALNWISMLVGAMLAAGAMLFTRCCTISTARRSVDWETLLAIAASFGIAAAMESTGAAKYLAESLVGLAQGDAWTALAMMYLATLVTTELITNNAAAALMFPLAIAAAKGLGEHGVNHMPFVIVVMMAASAGFATPIGYQTNLMVYGPGAYRFSDYLRIGLLLDILIGVVTIALVPLFWPF
jgi:di/tricarboxylate transporter